MSLKFTVDSLDAVPEAFHGEYVERDGKYFLSVEGAVPKDRLDSFRTNNLELKKQLEEFQSRYDGVDPDKFRELSDKDAKLREKKLIESGKVDELLAQRVEAMKAEHDKTLGSVAKERDAIKGQLEGLLIDSALRDAAAKAGVRPTAIDDVLLRGRQTFRLAEGKAAAFEGDKPIYGKDSEPLSVSEWVSGLSERAPHLFEPSTGGGTPAGGSQGKGGQNTIKRSQFDALPPHERAKTARSGVKIVD